ncbi:hypothetical protein [Anaerolentibacter hominis]|uniref:hypothetical protein n=1 Tax=Anaerolentibacter hominis TaxID=3079009 RepID=UPI0031B87902
METKEGNMKTLTYKLIPEGIRENKIIPLTIVFVDNQDVVSCGLTPEDAIRMIAAEFDGPVGINIFDMNAVTTTSDGIMVDSAIIRMGAGDRGRVNPDFGILSMEEMPYSPELVLEEPHLKQWQALYPGRKLYRGPNPANKRIPVHNVVITGRASNNNSATEMMNIVTMEEILLPYLGQREIMTNGRILFGYTGEVISVGIGMTVKEKYGRVFPHRQFGAGDTAHNSGEYAKTLKRDIPCIVAEKPVLARYTLRALTLGLVPGKDIGCSPAVLSVARALGSEIAYDNITPAAWEELASVGITKDWLLEPHPAMTPEEIIEHAPDLIPGVSEGREYAVSDFCETRSLTVRI